MLETKTGADPVPETWCCILLFFNTLGKGKLHKVNKLRCDLPSSEPCRLM